MFHPLSKYFLRLDERRQTGPGQYVVGEAQALSIELFAEGPNRHNPIGHLGNFPTATPLSGRCIPGSATSCQAVRLRRKSIRVITHAHCCCGIVVMALIEDDWQERHRIMDAIRRRRFRIGWFGNLHAVLLVCAIVNTGCHGNFLRHPQSPPSTGICSDNSSPSGWYDGVWIDLQSLNTAAQESFAAAMRLDARQDASCVDFYYRAALEAERCLEAAALRSGENLSNEGAIQIYQQSISQLIEAGQKYGRLDPRKHLLIAEGNRWREIPIAYYGFAWKPSDFCQLISADEPSKGSLAVDYQSPGLGAALIGVRNACVEEPFHQSMQPFAVTAILRPAQNSPMLSTGNALSASASRPDAVLEFYNPHFFDSVRIGTVIVRLNRNLSASFAYASEHAPRNYLEGFLDPRDGEVKPKLWFLEPYQPGKIPLVLIHGLYSEPSAWLDAVNELCAQPDIYRQYQIWFYGYPTGGAVLESAAKLREQLLVARDLYDPAHQDPSLERMVLVGHSMGGLIAKLQVTYSSDLLWRQAAKQPFEAVRTNDTMRKRLENAFFFDPSPLVSRVVYIGTPHRGSVMARRLVGQAASGIIKSLDEEEPEYRQLMDENQDIFYEYIQRSPPTSVDLLEPSNPFLEALACLSPSPRVRFHSIIGTGGSILAEPGDGVVPVASARQSGAISEVFVPVRHQKLHHDEQTLAELVRILREHSS